jgi:N-acetylglutamate synthase-like GNAT family acetyltransferase
MRLDDIVIRNDLRPGDIGSVVHLHGTLYGSEYGYSVGFEAYVALGLHEFYQNYDAKRDRVWICEHENRMIGFLLLMHRESDTAQLRYFLICPEYRGIGLGKRLMELFMEFMRECRFQSAYLWTVDELPAAASLYTRFGFRLIEEKPASAFFGKPLKEQRYDLIMEGQS